MSTATSVRAIGYCRVSTQEQAREGVSVAAQEAAVRGYCAMRGIDLVEVVIDGGVSASTALAKRPGGGRVLAMIESGEANAVIATKLDRLFRDTLDALTSTRAWDKAGIGLHLLDMNIDTSTAVGRLFLSLVAALAEMERNLIGERTSAALAHVKAQGGTLGGEALGWRRGPERVPSGRLAVTDVAEEREAVDRIIVLHRDGLSLRGVAAALAQEGHQTKKGRGRWHASTVRAVLRRELGEGCRK
jgi:site-specific DNA recombinase